MMEIHGFTEDGAIDATIMGFRMTVPDDPANRDRLMIAAWEAEGNTIPAYAVPPATVEHVKAECRRRILLMMTEDQQRNTLAAGQAAVMQYGADPSLWPEELQQRQAAAMLAWTEIERLRSRSNQIELMDPIPADIVDDSLWA